MFDLEGLHPRVGINVGVTMAVDEFTYVKPSIYLEIDVPDNTSVAEAIDQLTDYLIDKLVDIEEKLDDYVKGS